MAAWKSAQAGTTSWTVKGVQDATREAVREAAAQAGMLLGEWVEPDKKHFFEIDEAAKFLDAARKLDLHHALIATYLLTGGRRNEVLGLLVSDIDFENNLRFCTSPGVNPPELSNS